MFCVPAYRFLIRRSYVLCFHMQCMCMIVGGILYSLGQLANSFELVIVARVIQGAGGGFYPMLQVRTCSDLIPHASSSPPASSSSSESLLSKSSNEKPAASSPADTPVLLPASS